MSLSENGSANGFYMPVAPASYGIGNGGFGGGNSRGYSGHMNKEDIKKDLQEMMNKTTSDKERMAIQQLLEQWKD